MNKLQRKLSRLLGDRRGTAEIIGSVMFLVILLFVFTNVYLWHDTATREMNGALAEKMNSGVSIEVDDAGNGLVVTNDGGFEVCLSRLWLITGSGHFYADLEHYNVRVAAGESVQVLFVDGAPDSGNTLNAFVVDGGVLVQYTVSDSVVCKVLTTLGNMAACTYAP